MARRTIKADRVISAEVHSDDRVFSTGFDAVEFFRHAEQQEIIDLALRGWAGDRAADAVAQASTDENVVQVLGYVTRVPGIGFECSVDEETARVWLAENRPDVLRALDEAVSRLKPSY